MLILYYFVGFISATFSQNYTSFFTGNTLDITTVPSGGICLMGGASEDDNAMIWFLERANGGDVLVLRASGSDGYNNYMYSELGVGVNSVETIVFNNASAANENYVHQKIRQAEAIWFAGGDQWDYVSYWRNTAIDNLINDAISNRNIVIGGTSAGMAIQGGFYFSAENGTVTSATALSNPFNSNVTVSSTAFISNNYLHDVITDTHYDNPDRKGRHLVFMSRILLDYGIEAKGIACDEYTAVCIDTNGSAKVFGEYPNYDDNAYFLQTNCELSNNMPEDASPGNPLDWNLGNEAIKVYAIKGTTDGSNTFDLNDWQTGTGGAWENWYVANGVFNELAATQPNCIPLSVTQNEESTIFNVYPNPSTNVVRIEFNAQKTITGSLKVVNQQGQIKIEKQISNSNKILLNTSDLPTGVYFIEILRKDQHKFIKKLIVK